MKKLTRTGSRAIIDTMAKVKAKASVKKFPPIVHRFEINEDKWQHGPESTDDSEVQGVLYDTNTKKMCCLGFLGVSCGLTPRDMKGYDYPGYLPPDVLAKADPKLEKFSLNRQGDNTATIERLVHLNDIEGLKFDVRKKKITDTFRKIGVAVTFYSKKKNGKTLDS